MIDGVINHEPPALARFNYNIPAELERVVLKLLAKDPDYRYQSARELYIDLSAIARVLDHPSHPHSHVQPAPAGFSPAWRGCRSRCRTRAQAGSVRPDRSAAPGRRPLRGASNGSRAKAPARSPSRAPTAARAASWSRRCSRRSVPQVDRAVAVMTFANITRDANDEWIGSGIAETVTSDLKNVRGINVIGRTQVFDALKHLSTADLQRVNDQVIDIGRRLGATWIVGGAYQRLGPRIRITAEFVDVRSGRLLKTVKVDGKVDDLFSLQDKIVYELSQGLNVNLRPSEIQAIARAETGSIEAYEAFSRGTMNLRLGTPESMDRAIEQFEQALGIDPHYASAWALLGVTCNLKGQFLTLPDLTRRAVELLEHALALDPNHAAAHAGLGGAYLGVGTRRRCDPRAEAGDGARSDQRARARLAGARVLDRPGRDRGCDRGARTRGGAQSRVGLRVPATVTAARAARRLRTGRSGGASGGRAAGKVHVRHRRPPGRRRPRARRLRALSPGEIRRRDRGIRAGAGVRRQPRSRAARAGDDRGRSRS